MSDSNWYSENLFQAGVGAVTVLGIWSAWLTKVIFSISKEQSAQKERDSATTDAYKALIDVVKETHDEFTLQIKESREESTRQHTELGKEIRADMRVLQTVILTGQAPGEDAHVSEEK